MDDDDMAEAAEILAGMNREEGVELIKKMIEAYPEDWVVQPNGMVLLRKQFDTLPPEEQAARLRTFEAPKSHQ
jgi:hypothetical protein